MKLKNPLEPDNLNNGQWVEIFTNEASIEGGINTVVIESSLDYYSSLTQTSIVRDRKFIDRSSLKKIVGSNTVANAFDTSISKDRATKTGYLSSSVDPYRQGVEITLPRHIAGLVKISAGTPGHFINPAPFGLSENINLTDNDFFQELNLFNSVEFIQAQDSNKLIEQIITFPIVTSDTNQRENSVLNGIIEPFPIRPIISYFSLYFPAEPHGIKANFSNGDILVKKASDIVSSVYDFLPNAVNKEIFLDASEPITMSNDEGTSTVEVGPNIPYLSTDTNFIEPFKDIVFARGDELELTRNYDNDLLAAVRALPPMETTYLNINQISGRTGFSYNNSIQGVDSIVYGGLSR